MLLFMLYLKIKYRKSKIEFLIVIRILEVLKCSYKIMKILKFKSFFFFLLLLFLYYLMKQTC